MSNGNNPATGNRGIFGFRRELEKGVPDTTRPYDFYKAVLPVAFGLQRPEVPSNQVNASGYTEAGVPGLVGTAQDFGVQLRAGQILEPLRNLLGSVSKTALEDGVYAYDFEEDSDLAKETMQIVWGLPPTSSAGYLYGFMVDSIAISVAQGPLVMRMPGKCIHGTPMDMPTADLGNAGAYRGPVLRGPMARSPYAPIYITVTRDVASGGLRYKAEQTAAAPTFPGPEIDVVASVWQNLQVALHLSGTVTVAANTTAVSGTDTKFDEEIVAGQWVTIAGESIRVASVDSRTALTLASNHTAGAVGVAMHILNRDAGFHGRNKDPMEIRWPDAASYGDANINDTWSYANPGEWSAPTPVYIDGGHEMTPAHWAIEIRDLGDSVWTRYPATGGQLTVAWPSQVSTGNLSKYPNRIFRAGQALTSGNFTREFVDDFFERRKESHRRFEFRQSWNGQQIGSGLYRESVSITNDYATMTSRTVPVSSANEPVIETLNWQAESDPATGGVPSRFRVITTRDWTP